MYVYLLDTVYFDQSQCFRLSLNAPLKQLFFPFFSNAPRSPPSRCFDVTGVRLRTWMEECRSSDSDTPPSALLLQLFASRPRRQTASRSPTCCCAEPCRLPPSTGVVYSTCAGPSRTGQRVRSPLFLLFSGGEFKSLRALFSNCPSRHMEKMARPLPINPTFLPPTHGVLKSLLENPLKLPFHHDEGTFKPGQNLKQRARTLGRGVYVRAVVVIQCIDLTDRRR